MNKIEIVERLELAAQGWELGDATENREPKWEAERLREAASTIEALASALEPFAEYGHELSGPIWDKASDDGSANMKGVPPFTIGDFRRARSALSSLYKKEG
jgi:hypothetical protein